MSEHAVTSFVNKSNATILCCFEWKIVNLSGLVFEFWGNIYIFWICSSRGSRWYQFYWDWLSFHWNMRDWHVGRHRSRSVPARWRLWFGYKKINISKTTGSIDFILEYDLAHYVPQLEKNFGWEIPSSFGDINFFVICVLGGHVGGQCRRRCGSQFKGQP